MEMKIVITTDEGMVITSFIKDEDCRDLLAKVTEEHDRYNRLVMENASESVRLYFFKKYQAWSRIQAALQY